MPTLDPQVSSSSTPSQPTIAVTNPDGTNIAAAQGTVEGTTTDAAVVAGATGTISAKLRAISRDIASLTTDALGAANIATGQISVAATAGGTVIVAANAKRRSLVIINTGTTDVYVGNTGLTTSTGQLLVGIKGAGLAINAVTAVYGIVSSSTQTVTYLEEYDT